MRMETIEKMKANSSALSLELSLELSQLRRDIRIARSKGDEK